MFGPVSGAHFNPVVSFVDAAFGGLSWRHAAAYLPAQVAGCIGGAVLANLMFGAGGGEHLDQAPGLAGRISCPRSWPPSGLMLVIFALARSGRARLAPAAVGAYIGAAYFFTSSTSFANPAITVGRMFSNTFAGIAPSSAPASSLAQIVGGVRRVRADQGPLPRRHRQPRRPTVIVPHPGDGRTGRQQRQQPARPHPPSCQPPRTGTTTTAPGLPPPRAEDPMHIDRHRRLRRRHLRRAASPRARPGRRGDRGGGRRLPQLLDLRHPLLHLRRGDPLAQPGPPQLRRPGSHRHAPAPRHPGHPHRRRRAPAVAHSPDGSRGTAGL